MEENKNEIAENDGEREFEQIDKTDVQDETCQSMVPTVLESQSMIQIFADNQSVVPTDADSLAIIPNNTDNKVAEIDGEREFFTLTDEEGNEVEFELIDSVDYQGVTYYAMIPADAEGDNEDGFQEYVILKMEKDEDGEDMLVTLDDDEEFDNVADIFDDRFSEEVDYDDKQ